MRIILATPLSHVLVVDIERDEIVGSSWLRVVAAKNRTSGIGSSALAKETARQVVRYFARRLVVFDVPLALEGTELECAVWRATATIPFGARVSYGDVARAIDRPRSARGVARALARAPLALFIPAHRVVGSDGRIRGAEPNSMRAHLLAFETGDADRRTPKNGVRIVQPVQAERPSVRNLSISSIDGGKLCRES